MHSATAGARGCGGAAVGANMSNKVQPTNAERATAVMEARAIQTMKRDYPDLCFNDDYGEPSVYFITALSPLQLLGVEPGRKRSEQGQDGEKTEERQLYFVWDGGEFTTFDDPEEAITDFVSLAREKTIRTRWQFYASPLIISGVIAIGLLSTIASLLFLGRNVPPELWSIFTAVAAFYFGKEGWTAMRERGDAASARQL